MGEIDPDSDKPDKIVRTRLDISTHAWNEDRGKALAWQVVRLGQAGCRVRVFYGMGMGAAVQVDPREQRHRDSARAPTRASAPTRR